MDEIRVQAAIAELNTMILNLMQRAINLAGDLAVAQKEIQRLTEALNQKEKQNEILD